MEDKKKKVGAPRRKVDIDKNLLKRMIKKRGFTIKSLCEEMREHEPRDNVEQDPQIYDETVYYCIKHGAMTRGLLSAICRRINVSPRYVTGEISLRIHVDDLNPDDLERIIERGQYSGIDEDGYLIPGYNYTEDKLSMDYAQKAEQDLIEAILSLYNWKTVFPNYGTDDFVAVSQLSPDTLQLLRQKIQETQEILEQEGF